MAMEMRTPWCGECPLTSGTLPVEGASCRLYFSVTATGKGLVRASSVDEARQESDAAGEDQGVILVVKAYWSNAGHRLRIL